MNEGLKLSIGTPIVTLTPGGCAEWEREASVEDLGAIVEAADRLGYHHLTCSEHVGVPAAELDRRGARYWDPLATFGYLAARTTQIKFATNVLVLGYHHPLEIAKRYGTLDLVSGGRVILGLGIGTLKEEFDVLGAPFDRRGRRADDSMPWLFEPRCPSRSPPTTGSSTTSRGSWSIPARCSIVCRSGSAAAASPLWSEQWRSEMAGVPSP